MKPILFIPGIEATALINANTFDFDFTWNAYDTLLKSIGTKITGPDIEEKLQEDPLYDQNVSSIVERNHIARLPYDRSIQNLASKYKDDPVYLFGYDWRLSAAVNGKRLADFVGYLKNKLRGNKLEGFRFVTHSMGCYVMGCYLTELNGNYNDISKVVFCAPPFRGSPYAIVHLVKGDGGPKSFLAKLFGRSEDIRKVVRTYPSLLELTPWYTNSVVFNDGTPVDLTNLDDWQSNIWDDIESLFRARLTALADFRNNRLCDLSGLPEDVRSRMIIIAGSKDNTLIGLKVDKQNGNTQNFIRLDEMVMGSGDGTVPFESSTIFKDSVRTIEVQKENLFAELGDNVDFHGFFMRDSRIQNILGRMFDDRVLSTLKRDKTVNALWGDENKDWWESVGTSVSSLSEF
jgi:pimeloyl-ACP methyl ester carboxylesterase